MANANYYFAQNGDLLDRKTKEKVGTWKAGADGKRKISLGSSAKPAISSGQNQSYAYREDGKLVDRATGKAVGTWKTSSKTGKRVATLADGSNPNANAGQVMPTATNPASRYGPQAGKAGVDFPTFYGPAAPGYPDTQRAFASGKEQSGISYLLPNAQQQAGSKGVPNLTTPQLSMTTVGKTGFTPGEIVNYLTEHYNQLRGAEDQRIQQGLDMMNAGAGESKRLLGKGLEDSLKYARGGAQGARDYLNQGMSAQNAALKGGIKTERQYFQQGLNKATGAMQSGQSGLLADYDKALGQGTGYLKDALGRTRGLFDKAYGYLGSLGKQQESRIGETYNKGIAADNQRMAGRGLSNTTINMTSKGVHERNKNDALLGVDEMRANANLGLNQQQRGAEYDYGGSLAGLSSGILQGRGNAQGNFGGQLANLYNQMYSNQGQAELGYGQGLANVAGQGYGALAQNQFNYGQAGAGLTSGAYNNMAQNQMNFSNNAAQYMRPNWNDPIAGIMGGFGTPKTDSNMLGQIGGSLIGGLTGGLTGGLGGLIGGGFGQLGNYLGWGSGTGMPASQPANGDWFQQNRNMGWH